MNDTQSAAVGGHQRTAESIRGDFPILAEKVHGRAPLVYLDNASSAQRPRRVLDALDNVYQHHYANVHRGIHWLSEQSTDLYERAREAVQRFINAEHVQEVIFTSGTTAAINLVARSWGDQHLRPGDEILLSLMEHHSNIVPWQQAAERTGASVRFLPLTSDGRLQLDELDQYLTKQTRLVALASISNVLGTINPLKTIVDRAHQCGAVVLVDAAQSVPHEATDVQQLNVDFLAFSSHKMMGPSGVGVLYGRKETLESMPPFLGGGSMIRRVTTEGFQPADLPYRFEAGTPPIADAIALTAAIDYLNELGLEWIAAHERKLVVRTHELFRDIGDIDIYGPTPELKAGIVSFNLRGVHPQDVAEVLDHHGVAVRAGHHCAMPLHQHLGVPASARASFYAYNTLDDVERLAEAVRDAKQTLRRRKD